MVGYEAVDKGSVAVWYTATELGRFKHALDDDGETTSLNEVLARGADIFHTFGERWEEDTDTSFVPHDSLERLLMTVEWRWFDTHGKTVNITFQGRKLDVSTST